MSALMQMAWRGLAVADMKLQRHRDHRVRRWLDMAATVLQHEGKTAMFNALYSCAEYFNPYKRHKTSKWRQLCHETAANGCQRCLHAQLFYELAEGSYEQTDTLNRIKSNHLVPGQFD